MHQAEEFKLHKVKRERCPPCGIYDQPRSLARQSLKRDEQEEVCCFGTKKAGYLYRTDRNGKYRVALRKYSERRAKKRFEAKWTEEQELRYSKEVLC